jgi:pantoate--beta-alanine ligase
LKTMIAKVKEGLTSSKLNIAAIEEHAMQTLRERGWQPDYMTVRKQYDLSPVTTITTDPLVVLAAAKLGKTRLIDNLEII